MNWLLCFSQGVLHNREGQGLIEYAFILILVAVVVILMLKGIGGTLNTTYSTINSSMP